MNSKVKPIFDDTDNCIVFSSNNDFIPCLSVMIQSIIDNSVKNKKYDILVLNKDILPLSQKVLSEMVSGYTNFSIRFINVTEYIDGIKFYTANRDNITEEAYYRLLIPWILDERYIRALYLDGDMVALTDVTKIFDIDLKGNIIAAVRDYWGICNCYIPNDSMKEYRKSIGIKKIDNYIISATILFDLEKFRDYITLDKVFGIVEAKQWKQHDQDVINIIMQGKILFISPSWGYMSDYGNNKYLPKYLQEDLKQNEDHINIVHFGGVRKPWSKLYVDYHMLFWQFAYRTPYFSFLLNKIRFHEYKAFVVYNLSKGKINKYNTTNGIELSYKGVSLGNYDNMIVRYQRIFIDSNNIHLEGLVGFYCVDENTQIKVYFDVNNEIIEVNKQISSNSYTDDRKMIYRGEFFSIDFNIDTEIEYKIKIISSIDGYKIYSKNFFCEKYFPLSGKYSESYYSSHNWVLKKNKEVLILRHSDNIFKYEQLFLKQIYSIGGLSNIKAVISRVICYILKRYKHRPIWMISDRLSKADDNGEAFFKYLNSIDNNIDTYFVISKNSQDFNRLKKYGNVVDAYSWKHKILLLLANVVIASQTDELFRNPFWGNYVLYKDYLSNIKFIFLQHGIISTDLSRWLCRRRQGISGFITSSEKEKEIILNGNYNYTDKELWLTGLPRFDYLRDSKEKLITIQPTWRKYLALYQDHKTGIWELVPNFSQSKYAKFFRNLLSNKKLLVSAKKYGYKIQFKIHPSFLSKQEAFNLPKNIIIVDDAVSYRSIYEKSSLIVTDYSSSVYDFLFLRKPIIYCQFDKEEFFNGKHMGTQSYFDYEKDGFGEVEYDLESTVNRIIEYMQNNCTLKEKYRERIDRFFAFNDRNNCQRVYEAIKSLDN